MNDSATRPESVGPSEDGAQLRIEWKDGHVSFYPPRSLRLRCPCAGCVDELTGERMLTPGMVREDVHPLSIQYVGRYALQFHWSDGHSTGIFPFEYLRGLCPCSVCTSAPSGGSENSQ